MNEVATRYSEALVSIAKEEKKLEQYKFAILSIQELFASNEDVLKYLKSYFIKDDEKFVVIDEMTKEFKLPNFTNFIKLIVIKHKISMYKEIVKEVTKDINFELGIYEGFVYSTEPLSNDKISELNDVIGKKLNRKVELKNKIDTRLIGGIKVVVHDHIFDGSIKYKLETLNEQLKERRNG